MKTGSTRAICVFLYLKVFFNSMRLPLILLLG
nr:MAG TPA: hypothetical protein [Caudoviricetes sp.]